MIHPMNAISIIKWNFFSYCMHRSEQQWSFVKIIYSSLFNTWPESLITSLMLVQIVFCDKLYNQYGICWSQWYDVMTRIISFSVIFSVDILEIFRWSGRFSDPCHHVLKTSVILRNIDQITYQTNGQGQKVEFFEKSSSKWGSNILTKLHFLSANEFTTYFQNVWRL